MSVLADGLTPDGRRILAEERDGGYVVTVNGERVKIVRSGVLRDGGTRVITTEDGCLKLPRRLNDPDRTPTWDGHALRPYTSYDRTSQPPSSDIYRVADLLEKLSGEEDMLVWVCEWMRGHAAREDRLEREDDPEKQGPFFARYDDEFPPEERWRVCSWDGVEPADLGVGYETESEARRDALGRCRRAREQGRPDPPEGSAS